LEITSTWSIFDIGAGVAVIVDRGVAVFVGSGVAVLVGDGVKAAVRVAVATAPGVIRGVALDTAVGTVEVVAPCACARVIRADPNNNNTAAATVKLLDPCCPSIG
jgi:hypothetical protein